MFFSNAKPKATNEELTEDQLLALCNRVADKSDQPEKDVEATVTNMVKAVSVRSNEALQLSAVLALVTLAEQGSNKALIVQKGALAPVVRLCLSTDNDRALYGAARLLWHLSTEEKNKFRIASEGGFQVITLMASSLISHIQYAAARILLLLAEDENLRARILDSNLPNTLSELLCSETDSVQYVAANTINYLASQSPENDAFSQDRVMSKLMDLIRVGNENCQWAACSAVRAISQHEPNRLRVLALGVVPHLIGFINGPSERLKYVAMLTLIALDLNPEAREALLEEGSLEKIALLFGHAQDQMAVAAIQLVGALSKFDDSRGAVIQRVGFRAFLDLIVGDRAPVRIAATTALAYLLTLPEVQVQFFTAGLLEDLIRTLVSETAPVQHVMAAVTVLYSLSSTDECRRAIANREGGVEALSDLASQDLIASLMYCGLAEAELVSDLTPVETFLETANYTAPHHSNMLMWDEDSLRRIETLGNSVRPTVRVAAAWTYCCVATIPENVDMLVAAQSHTVLNRMQDVPPHADQAAVQIRLCAEALKLMAASGPVTGDVGERFEGYIDLIAAEKAPIDKILDEYGAVVKTLDSLDVKKLRQQAPVFEDKEDLSPPINAALRAVRLVRDEITGGSQYQQIKAMDDDIRLTITMIEKLRKLQEKADVVESLREQMKQIDKLSEEIARQNKSLARERKTRDDLNTQHTKVQRSIETAKQAREQKNVRVLNIMTELVDLEYQQGANPGIKDELSMKKDALLQQLKELEDRREAAVGEVKALKLEIAAQEQAKMSYESKLKELAQTKAYAAKLQTMKKSMQDTVGNDLADNEDYLALQGSMLNKVFDQLDKICTDEPAVDVSIDRADGLDGNAKERAMTGTIQRVEITIRSWFETADNSIKLAEQKINTLNGDVEKLDEEIGRLKDEIAELDRQLGGLMSSDELEARIAELKAELAAVREAIDAMDARLEGLERERKEVHNTLTEASSRVAGIEAAVRRFTNDRKEARKAFDTQYRGLNDALDEFFEGYNTYVLKREVLKAKIRALEDLLRDWKRLFVVEAEKRAVANSAIKSALTHIQTINDALEECAQTPLLMTDT